MSLSHLSIGYKGLSKLIKQRVDKNSKSTENCSCKKLSFAALVKSDWYASEVKRNLSGRNYRRSQSLK